ncbi:MAG: hypothetical protein JSS93_04220 [Bacteroidetes bacterium]|nr:hypothetical protein [Bacteroidota bacterium]MBS1981707.1 hypothetical protein [Bacteroidota bacterium]
MNDKIRKWDKENSTYCRVLVMENGRELVGYSKKIGMEEKQDKTDVLTNWIVRDFEAGYLDKNTVNPKITRLKCADWYKRITKNPLEYELMFTLYYDTMEWHKTMYAEDKRLVEFLKKFYWLVRKNPTATTVRNSLYVTTRAEKTDPLSIERPRFMSIEDLNFYLSKLQNDGRFTPEQINHFYISYKEKYFTKR